MEEILEEQRCFVKNGFMFCNWILRNGKVVKPKKDGVKNLRWFVGYNTPDKQKEAKPDSN